MCFALDQHRSFCFVGDRAVLLDLAADRYWQAGAVVSEALERASRNRTLAADDLLILTAAGVVPEDIVPSMPLVTMVSPPARLSAFESCGFVLLRPHVVQSWWSLRRTGRAIRRGRLAALVAALREARGRLPAPGSSSTDDLRSAVQSFLGVARLLGRDGQCMINALALSSMLTRLGHDVAVVFGVTLRPFAAHCWVQHGEIVLTDHVDAVADYTPILIV